MNSDWIIFNDWQYRDRSGLSKQVRAEVRHKAVPTVVLADEVGGIIQFVEETGKYLFEGNEYTEEELPELIDRLKKEVLDKAIRIAIDNLQKLKKAKVTNVKSKPDPAVGMKVDWVQKIPSIGQRYRNIALREIKEEYGSGPFEVIRIEKTSSGRQIVLLTKNGEQIGDGKYFGWVYLEPV